MAGRLMSAVKTLTKRLMSRTPGLKRLVALWDRMAILEQSLAVLRSSVQSRLMSQDARVDERLAELLRALGVSVPVVAEFSAELGPQSSMHILVDGQALQSDSRGRGVGRYAGNLLQALAITRPTWRFTIIEAGHLPAIERGPLPASFDYLPLSLPVLPANKRHNRWLNDRGYGDWLSAQRADVFLSLHSFEKWGVHPLGGVKSMPHVGILYDLIPQRFEEIYLNDPVVKEFYSDRLQQTREADLLLAISDWTARDYRELQPNGPADVATIGGAPDPHLLPMSAERLAVVEPAMRARYRLERGFILNPSGQCWRKNSRGAFLAFIRLPHELRDTLDFVVACKINRAEEEEIRRLAEEHGLRDAVRFTGYVSDEDLKALYQRCRVCIFPSFYEGIGLPIVEALQCGAPVVTNDCSSLPEFAGPHAFLADPLDTNSLAAALTNALLEPRELHEQARVDFARRFRWESIAERTARAMASAALAAPRSRIAWMANSRSGIDDMQRLEDEVSFLSKSYSVEVILPEGHPGVRPAFECVVPVISISDFRDRQRMLPFDRVIDDGATDTAEHRWLAPAESQYSVARASGSE